MLLTQAEPTGITLNPSVINERIPEVEVSFTAPGDDQSGGDRVQAYEARWSYNNINSQLTWAAAEVLDDLTPLFSLAQLKPLWLRGFPLTKAFILPCVLVMTSVDLVQYGLH